MRKGGFTVSDSDEDDDDQIVITTNFSQDLWVFLLQSSNSISVVNTKIAQPRLIPFPIKYQNPSREAVLFAITNKLHAFLGAWKYYLST